MLVIFSVHLFAPFPFFLQIWSHMNGECLHVMSCSGSTEVTGVVHLFDRAQFLSVGWNKRIISFNDKSDVSEPCNSFLNFRSLYSNFHVQCIILYAPVLTLGF